MTLKSSILAGFGLGLGFSASFAVVRGVEFVFTMLWYIITAEVPSY